MIAMKDSVLDLIKIDIGCGSNKKEGCLGIDCEKFEHVDFILDVTKDRLPFDDKSVSYIFSSHFFEHIKVPNFLFSEISRVATDEATLEVWTPYAHSDDAFCYGHEIFFTEEHWLHICVKYPEAYYPIIHARWLLKKIIYIIDQKAYEDITDQGFDIGFAIKYFKGIIKEIGVVVEIRHEKDAHIVNPERYFAFQRGTGNSLIKL